VLASCTDILHDINYKDMLLHGNFCVPILSGERVLGVMNLLVEEGYKENPEDRELLTSVAKTLAGIIERNRTEQEKQKLQEQLVQAEKLSALGRLTANVAHEIRNPLTSIGGYARRLNKTAPQGLKEKEYIEVIVSEVDRLERILRNVLTFSREARLNLTSCDMNEVINESLRFYEVMCKEHSVRTETSLPVLPRIMIDKDMVRETINNIISNALDAMQGGGAPTITTEMEPYRKKKYLTVKIADTGKGIPEDKLNMIFEPFFSTKLTGHGTGLGLSICKKIVEDHGGFIRAVSKEGKGPAFSLYFPYEFEGQTGR
jgi:signal transduction histidine kinase